MMLDTGASRTFVPIQYAGEVKLRDLAGVGNAVLANGAQEEFIAATVNKIEIGDEKTAWVANITVGIGGHSDDILLGRDFLKRFKSWSFDEATGTLTITAKQ
jgi:predicted aspartyl protease